MEKEISKMSSSKAPGANGISANLLKDKELIY